MGEQRPLYNPLAPVPDLSQASSNLYAGSTLLGLAAASPNPLTAAHGGLGSYISVGALTGLAPEPGYMLWQYVIPRFRKILANTTISTAQREAGEKSQAGVRACLNRHYWGYSSDVANSALIGSWGKETRGRPSRDIDILFLLPAEVYHRFETRAGNRQSQLLQEVKCALGGTYAQTVMRGDGQVVLVPFNTIPIEVAIGFQFTDGSIRVCDTNDGGRYTISAAAAELADLNRSDAKWHGNTRALIRITKRWQDECNVPLKSFQLERLAVEFLDLWAYSNQGLYYYDWMVRDFFGYMRTRANTAIIMPGTGEIVQLGQDWVSRAETAHRNATNASEYERNNQEYPAGQEWRKIFGAAAPAGVA